MGTVDRRNPVHPLLMWKMVRVSLDFIFQGSLGGVGVEEQEKGPPKTQNPLCRVQCLQCLNCETLVGNSGRAIYILYIHTT